MKTLLYILLLLSTSVCAQTFTSAVSGSFTDGATWGNASPGVQGTDYPANNDDVIITTGTVVEIITNKTIRRLVIQSGGELTANATVRVRGSYTCNGIHSGTGQTRLQNGNDTIAGTGAITTTANFRANVKRTIVEGSNLLRQNGNFRCPNNDTLFNYGTLTLDEVNLNGNSTGSFYNGETGVLNAERAVISSGTLIASAVGNRVIYNRTGNGNQDIKTPVDGYYNLELTGTSTNSKRDVDANFIVLNDLTINGPEMRFNGAFTVSVGGDLVMNSGSVAVATGTFEMNGSSQSINGAFTFNNLTISNGSSVSIISSGVGVEGVLDIISGTLTTGGNLTMISNASGTSSIASLGGSISGQVTCQRYLPAGPTAWRFLSSPVNGVSYADWQDDFTTSGYPGSSAPNFSFVSAYYYDESVPGAQNIGFIAPSNASNALQTGRGYFMWVGDGQTNSNPIDIDLTGTINGGSVSLPVSYTSNNTVVEDGWCVVGNPYMSTIDWDSPNWTKTNMDNAVYVWNASLGLYSSYAGGIGANGGSNLIPSSQAFYVKANAASPVLIIEQDAKTNSSGTFLRPRTDQAYLTVTMDDGAHVIETGIKLAEEASSEFDPALDAHFLAPPMIAGIYTTFGAERYSINTLSSRETHHIPLYFSAAAGEIEFTFSLDIDPGTHCFALLDEQSGTVTPIYNEERFTLENVSVEPQHRYSILIAPTSTNGTSPCATETVTGVDNPAGTNDGLGVWMLGREAHLVGSAAAAVTNYSLYSIGGVLLATDAPRDARIPFDPTLSSGLYLLELHTAEGSTTHKIILTP